MKTLQPTLPLKRVPTVGKPMNYFDVVTKGAVATDARQETDEEEIDDVDVNAQDLAANSEYWCRKEGKKGNKGNTERKKDRKSEKESARKKGPTNAGNKVFFSYIFGCSWANNNKRRN